jgi:ABC-type enterochelin transport system permease subunit
MQKIITESIRYWEPRRLIYNAALGIFVLGFALYHRASLSALTWQPVAGLMLAAVVANLLYCSAYVADIFVQMSDYQQAWKARRWLLLALGIALAIAVFCATRD